MLNYYEQFQNAATQCQPVTYLNNKILFTCVENIELYWKILDYGKTSRFCEIPSTYYPRNLWCPYGRQLISADCFCITVKLLVFWYRCPWCFILRYILQTIDRAFLINTKIGDTRISKRISVVGNSLQIMCQKIGKKETKGEEWEALTNWWTLNFRNQKFKSYAKSY